MIYESIRFGNRVAEDESNQLSNYFLDTKHWTGLIEGDVDVVLGPKGSGKSALYLNLLSKGHELQAKGIYLLKAENPRGETIFSLFNQETANRTYTYEDRSIEYLIEKDIVAFWKLYFLTIIVTELKKEEINDAEIKKVVSIFEECGLIPQEKSLKNIFRHVIHYLKQVVTLQFFQPEIELDPITGTVKSIKGKISFEEPSPKMIEEGHFTLDDIIDLLDKGLARINKQVWVAIDRLDVAFQEDLTLEKRALSSLFTVYNSIKSYSNIHLKIFLREDIWEKVLTIDGMRESSHITRLTKIKWDKTNTFYLIMKRIANIKEVCDLFDLTEEKVLANIHVQEFLFNKVFPEKMTTPEGKTRPTFEWMLEMLKDGNSLFTPREVIHLLNEVNSIQREMSSFGHEPKNSKLYSEAALLKSITEVSKVKLEQTLLAENPEIAEMIIGHFKFANPKIDLGWVKDSFDLENENQARSICLRLHRYGFLRRNMEEFWIPHLFQEALRE